MREYRLVSPFGTSKRMIIINIHRLQPMKRVNYSTGAVWVSLDNLHRSVRFLRENNHLAITLPGPNEPTTEQLNKVIKYLTDEILDLELGQHYSCSLMCHLLSSSRRRIRCV
jgi:hypothetical protein